MKNCTDKLYTEICTKVIFVSLSLFIFFCCFFYGIQDTHAASVLSEMEGRVLSSSGAGWTSLNCRTAIDGSDICDTSEYRVSLLSDDSLEGFAWNGSVGWIQFSGLTGCPVGNCTARLDRTTGELLGWAEIVSSGEWISLNCKNDSSCGSVGYGVQVAADGTMSGYAWNSGALGWIDFSNSALVESKPDLVVRSVTDSLSGNITEGQTVTFAADVTNLGGISGGAGGNLSWSQIGNSYYLNVAGYPGISGQSITALSNTDVAYVDHIVEELRTYRFDGINWTQVGNSLVLPPFEFSALAALNDTDVVFAGRRTDYRIELRVYRFDGTNWSQIGNPLVRGYTPNGTPVLTSLTETDVVFADSENDELIVYRFDGTNWTQVGNPYVLGSSAYMAFASLNESDIAFIDFYRKLRVYRFDGLNWSQVGNERYIGNIGSFSSITALSGTDVALSRGAPDELHAYHFDGADWTTASTKLSWTNSGYLSITALTSTDVAHADSLTAGLKTYRLMALPATSQARFCIGGTEADCYTDTGVNTELSTSFVPALDASGGLNDFESITSSSWTATVGDHTLWVCADVDYELDESIEGNNCTSYSFTVVSAATDGLCGMAATNYAYDASGFSGSFCDAGTSNPVSLTFPVQGGVSYWSCEGIGVGSNAAACQATRDVDPGVVTACGDPGLVADPPLIRSGETTTLTWENTTDGSTCTLTGGGETLMSDNEASGGDPCNENGGNELLVNPRNTTTYTLTCDTDTAGNPVTWTDTVTVYVLPSGGEN